MAEAKKKEDAKEAKKAPAKKAAPKKASAAKGKKTDAKVAPWMYDVVRKPLITEKATMGSEHGQVTFEVAKSASKPEIKKAVEALFKVKVTKVNTLIMKGKTKRFRGFMGQRNDFKKAVVTLQDGQTIDVGSGI